MLSNIVLAIDINNKKFNFSSYMSKILNLVYAFNSKLHIVNIIPKYGMFVFEDLTNKEWYENYKNQTTLNIKKIVKAYFPENLEICIYIEKGNVFEEVIKYSLKNQVDLIILLSKNNELSPNIQQIIKHSPISTLILKG